MNLATGRSNGDAVRVAAAAAIAGSQDTSGPVLPDGTYDVPNSMPYGTYSAIPGPKGSCAFYIYDNAGKLIDLRQLHQRI